MHLSFAGCGFLGIYHVGVSSCIKEYAPHLCNGKIAGSSAGAVAACALLCGCCLGKCTSYVLRIASKARRRALGPLHPSFQVVDILVDGLRRILPADAHHRASGRLHVSLTRVSDGRNVIVSQYDSRDELIQALICSSYVPFYSGVLPPKFKGVRYMDGGLSNNLPVLDDNTITVSPFSGETDICPNDNSANFIHINLTNTSIQMNAKNIYRMSRAFFPPHPQILSNMCKQGFDDALKYLQSNSLISCTRCLSMKSVISLSEVGGGEVEDSESGGEEESGRVVECCTPPPPPHSATVHPLRNETTHCLPQPPPVTVSPPTCHVAEGDNCHDCRRREQIALLDTLPPAVVHVLESTIDAANQGILAKVYRYKAAKVLALMSIPWLLPLDISYYVAIRVVEYMPAIPSDMYWLVGELAHRIRQLMYTVHQGRHKYTAKFSCQFALTEIEEERVDGSARLESPRSARSGSTSAGLVTVHMSDSHELHLSNSKIKNVNFGFTVNWEAERVGGEVDETGRNSHRAPLQLAAESVLDRDSAHPSKRIINYACSQLDSNTADTFDNVLRVTSEHDALIAYYYVDEEAPNASGQVKVVEIFDVTHQDLGILDGEERETVARMSWDNDAHLTPPVSVTPVSAVEVDGELVNGYPAVSDDDNVSSDGTAGDVSGSTGTYSLLTSECGDMDNSDLELSLDE